MTDFNLVQAIAALPSPYSLRNLPGCDALLLEFYLDSGVTMQSVLLNPRGTATPQVSLIPGADMRPFQFDVRIASTAGGTALGQATYQTSFNGGPYSAALPTAAGPISMPNGWVFGFAGGGGNVYNTDQTWQSCVVSVANHAASNVVEPAIGSPAFSTAGNANFIYNARAGLPSLQFDALGAVTGSSIQSFVCSALTATPDAPYTAIWVTKYPAAGGGVWSMGGGGDGSVLQYSANSTSLLYIRRSQATASQQIALWTKDTNWHVHASRYTGTQIEHWVDGVKTLSLTTLASTGTKDMSSASLFQIGKSYNFTPISGEYQGFALWKRFLTDYELAVCTRAVQQRLRFI